MADITSYRDFGSAAQAIFDYLRTHVGMDLWCVGRCEGENWIILEIGENDFGLRSGSVLPWNETLCIRMIGGDGPRLALDCSVVDAYRTAPVMRRVPIASYVGIPLRRRDGTLFGTLCGVALTPQPESLRAHEPLIDLLASLLCTHLEAEIARSMRDRTLERAAVHGLIDRSTGLWNRSGFELHLENEEARCSRFGHAAAVLTVHVPPQPGGGTSELSTEHSHAVAELLKSVVRGQDVVGRVSEREFAVLAVESDRETSEALLDRLRSCVSEYDLFLALGFARRDPAFGLAHAWEVSQRSVSRAA